MGREGGGGGGGGGGWWCAGGVLVVCWWCAGGLGLKNLVSMYIFFVVCLFVGSVWRFGSVPA